MCEIKQTTLSVSYIASETQQNTVSTWLLISYWVRYELYRRDWLWLWRTMLTVDWTSSNWHCMVKIISSRLIFAGCLYSEVFFVIFGSNNSGISSAFIGDAIGETSACWTWTDWFVIWLFACTDWLLVLFVWARMVLATCFTSFSSDSLIHNLFPMIQITSIHHFISVLPCRLAI